MDEVNLDVSLACVHLAHHGETCPCEVTKVSQRLAVDIAGHADISHMWGCCAVAYSVVLVDHSASLLSGRLSGTPLDFA